MHPMTEPKKPAKNVRKRTINLELFKQWKALKRTGDSTTIADALGVSKPTIDNALTYGAVAQQKIVDGITKFFADRLMKEKDDANILKELQVQRADALAS
jgi:endonuclease III-like uncharacterized protein